VVAQRDLFRDTSEMYITDQCKKTGTFTLTRCV